MLSDGLVGNLTSSVKPPKGTMDSYLFWAVIWVDEMDEVATKSHCQVVKPIWYMHKKQLHLKFFKWADAFCAWFVVSSAIASKTFSPNLHMWSVLSLEGRYVDWFGYVWVLDGTCIYQNFQSFWGPTSFPSASSCLCSFLRFGKFGIHPGNAGILVRKFEFRRSLKLEGYPYALVCSQTRSSQTCEVPFLKLTVSTWK